MFTIRSLSSRRVSGGDAAGTVLASDGKVLGVPFVRDGGRASLAATWAQDLVFSNLSRRLVRLLNCCFCDCAMPESDDSRRSMVPTRPSASCCWCLRTVRMMPRRACLTVILVLPST